MTRNSRILGRAQRSLKIPNGKSRPPTFCSAMFASGTQSAKATTFPSISAKRISSALTTGLSCDAMWSISWSVIGTKPQFFSQAEL